MSKQKTHWIIAGLVVALACALGGSALAKALDAPMVTSMSPGSAEPGKTVTITGSGLSGATVTFRKLHSTQTPVAATQAETQVSSDGTRILLTIPDGSDAANGMTAPFGRVQLVIATPGGTVTRSFDVMPLSQRSLAPVITGFTPRKAAAGHTVTISGSHLSGTKGVWLNGVKATFRVPSDSKILAIVPKHAKAGAWKVTTAVGTTASHLRFTVVAPST